MIPEVFLLNPMRRLPGKMKWWKKEYEDMTHLAQASGIWKLTQEKSGLRPRTLKRYLSLETLPMRPKWRQVIDTLNFVIHKSSSARASSKLEKRKIKLEQTLTSLGLRQALPLQAKSWIKLLSAKNPQTSTLQPTPNLF